MKHDDLVFDVGMHLGEDSEHYLERGYRVVAVEANPALVERAEDHFADAIAAGQLTVIGAAVADQAGTVEFSVSDQITIWSSHDEDFIARNEGWGTDYRTFEAPAVRFEDLLEEHGVPHYLKVDIEGADMLCLRALHEVSERPDYVSVESAVSGPRTGTDPVVDELAELWALGYRSFKFVDQTRHDLSFPPESSGPFGEQTRGTWAPIAATTLRAMTLRFEHEIGGPDGRWGKSRAGRAYRWLRTDLLKRPLGWYDLHARLGSPSR